MAHSYVKELIYDFDMIDSYLTRLILHGTYSMNQSMFMNATCHIMI